MHTPLSWTVILLHLSRMYKPRGRDDVPNYTWLHLLLSHPALASSYDLTTCAVSAVLDSTHTRI